VIAGADEGGAMSVISETKLEFYLRRKISIYDCQYCNLDPWFRGVNVSVTSRSLVFISRDIEIGETSMRGIFETQRRNRSIPQTLETQDKLIYSLVMPIR
jgi:hypothetical protein